MSKLLDFYRALSPDNRGRRLQDIWSWSDDELESTHDVIQWLFPLPEPSQYNPDAPLLTHSDVATFRAESGLREHLLRSYRRFLLFLGLHERDDGKIANGENFETRRADVWSGPNHNWLRITRVLRCLHLLGLQEHADRLHAWLESAYVTHRFPISDDTMAYWTEATRGERFHR